MAVGVHLYPVLLLYVPELGRLSIVGNVNVWVLLIYVVRVFVLDLVLVLLVLRPRVVVHWT